MEVYLVYGFPCFFLCLWLIRGRRKRSVLGVAGWMLQLLPALLVTGVMLLDCRLHPYGIPSSLLAADMLFLDAVVLGTVRFLSEKRRVSSLFLLLAAAGIVRSLSELPGQSSFPFDGTAYMVVTSCLLLTCSVVEEFVRMFPSGRLRGILQERVTFVFMKVACAQWLTFLGALILSACVSSGPAGRFLCLAVSLLLAVTYLYLQSSLYRGTPVIRAMPAAAAAVRQAVYGRDRVTDESRRMDLLFERVEEYMQKERPYLDDAFTMTQLATEMMTNKSMLSKTINDRAAMNFCRYVNTYRIQYAVSLMKRDKRLKVSELSLMSGFHSVASFNMAFKLVMNDTPSEYMRTLHSAGLARTAAGERSGPQGRP